MHPRVAAREAGETRYFTGESCKNGHIAERYTVTATCVACQNEYRIEWRQKNKGLAQAQARRYQRKRKGLPEPTRPCPNTCEICNRPSKKALCIDHDHKTGAFRGWLCIQCNTFIAILGDDLEGAEKVVRYFHRADSALVNGSYDRQVLRCNPKETTEA